MAKRKRTERPNTSQKTGLSNMNPGNTLWKGKSSCSTSGTHRATFTKIRATSDKRVKGDGSAATTNGTHP